MNIRLNLLNVTGLFLLLNNYSLVQGSNELTSAASSLEDNDPEVTSLNLDRISSYAPSPNRSQLGISLINNAQVLNMSDIEGDELKQYVCIAQNSSEDTFKRNQAAATLVELGRPDLAVNCYKIIGSDSEASATQRLRASAALEDMKKMEDAHRGYMSLVQDKNVIPRVRLEAIAALEKFGYSDLAKSFKSDILATSTNTQAPL